MTANQLSKALTKLGLSQSALARLIGVSDRMVRNWIAGAWPVPKQTAMLINLMLDTNTQPENLKP